MQLCSLTTVIVNLISLPISDLVATIPLTSICFSRNSTAVLAPLFPLWAAITAQAIISRCLCLPIPSVLAKVYNERENFIQSHAAKVKSQCSVIAHPQVQSWPAVSESQVKKLCGLHKIGSCAMDPCSAVYGAAQPSQRLLFIKLIHRLEISQLHSRADPYIAQRT
ncbi:hypothetical protein FVEG_15519 [Fusarium verticillioides 7600]|uniref:Uncharacterized protein n=1 Tax=Gibberella moniliformis (strain M3125 / FGSC 7600) TaxID=334819 RepID=W7MDY6_GIBM7|nr:hypothetical protein FVEG_15519 [Fusarium verticillioides 7600]EWG42957.1 hypothetical protein FVEG_15519 [Fusarium verticillioides 7600]